MVVVKISEFYEILRYPRDHTIFSRAFANAKRDYSNLYCMCMYVECVCRKTWWPPPPPGKIFDFEFGMTKKSWVLEPPLSPPLPPLPPRRGLGLEFELRVEFEV